ncbi:cytidylate kinase-like family protein [Dermatophilaceae bacterium Sec6.4]|nr:cytidylate kinase-like family protein [Actinomycetota bacterium]
MIVTISASYGAGGSAVGPRVAKQLGLEFIDRAVPVAVANELGISVQDAEAIEHDAPSGLWGFLAHMSSLSPGMAVPAPVDQGVTDRDVMRGTEAEIRKVADGKNAVILGHAAAMVLADHADVLHVRLDGRPEGRIKSAMQQHGIDEKSATAAQRENDRIRSVYAKHFYGVNSSDARHYDLVLDTVRIGWDLAEELIVYAARSGH